jgi:type IV secretion system protein VirB2
MKLALEKYNAVTLSLALLVLCAATMLPAEVLAQTATITVGGGGGGNAPSALKDVLCNVVKWFTGPIGGGIATLAIIVVGVGALMGKVSWGMAIIVGLGVGVIFGADTIVSALSSNASRC